jgi:predicted transcriptional regulator/transcriptional regulator with XRE-family HTH domain
MADRKIFAGPRVRRLRQTLGVTQAAMAKDLNISPSYLNLVERNQRPLTAQLLLRLAEAYSLDLRELSGEGETRLAAEMTEALADPVFTGLAPPAAEVMEVAAGSPAMAQAFLSLYHAYLRAARGEVDPVGVLTARDRRPPGDGDRFPIEEVRDYFHANSNFIAEVDATAERLYGELSDRDDLLAGLRAHLRDRHGIRVSVVPVHAMPDAQRRFDRHSRRLFLSELLPMSSRIFQTAVQVGLQDLDALFDGLVDEARLRTDDARRLCRIGLANYFAGALMMPYGPFLEAARKLRYDVAVLAGRFGASIEQVAHRLTTLQHPDRRGVPFFLLRLDNAGNISKRFAAGGFHFARFGGTCPRWRVHDAFATPGQTIVQPVELPDGTIYLTVSRTVDSVSSPHPEAPRKLAISLGCEISHASQVVYGDGLDLDNPSAVTPIGVTCRMCERPNCPARAFPPMTRPLAIDASRKNLSAFEFG